MLTDDRLTDPYEHGNLIGSCIEYLTAHAAVNDFINYINHCY